MNTDSNFQFELKLENRLRKLKWLIPLITITTGSLLLSCILLCLHYFNRQQYWTIIPAGLLAHAFFIVIVHDGAHKSITRTKFDRVLMNLGSALMLLPFYGEPFRKYHLIHHGNANSDVDPLWPAEKEYLFKNARWFYVLCECIPLLFTFYLLIKSNNRKPKTSKTQIIKAPTINTWYILFSSFISVLIIILFKPSLWFVSGSIFFLNLSGTLRHWCEHLGTDSKITSNTFWFPMGMGIGNHDTHHHSPHVSWFVLMTGLFYRKKSTDPLKTLYGVLFSKSFIHYKEDLKN
ncbi:MAG: fatty acid desaturase [Bacteroidota bacterium]